MQTTPSNPSVPSTSDSFVPERLAPSLDSILDLVLEAEAYASSVLKTLRPCAEGLGVASQVVQIAWRTAAIRKTLAVVANSGVAHYDPNNPPITAADIDRLLSAPKINVVPIRLDDPDDESDPPCAYKDSLVDWGVSLPDPNDPAHQSDPPPAGDPNEDYRPWLREPASLQGLGSLPALPSLHSSPLPPPSAAASSSLVDEGSQHEAREFAPARSPAACPVIPVPKNLDDYVSRTTDLLVKLTALTQPSPVNLTSMPVAVSPAPIPPGSRAAAGSPLLFPYSEPRPQRAVPLPP